MNMKDATSPAELKRELRLQTFLAIQGKYQPGKTAELTKDIGIIVDAILDEDKVSDSPQLKGVGASTGNKRTDRFLFKHGPYNDKTKELPTSLTGEPLANTVTIDGKDTEDGKPATYYRHKVGFSVDGSIKEYFFFSIHEKLYSSTDESLLDIWTFIHSRQGCQPTSPKQKDEVEIMFFGGDMNAQPLKVRCDCNGVPHQGVIRPTDSIDKYYLHSANIGFDGEQKKYYFYSLKQNYREMNLNLVFETLEKIKDFHKEDNM